MIRSKRAGVVIVGDAVHIRSNNVSGCKGVHWDSARQKWHAIITANGKKKALGRFASIEEAADAYARAAKVLHGEFARIS